MSDSEPCKSVLDKIFDCVNNGFNWTATQIKSACPHKRKKMEEDGDGEKFPGVGPKSSDDPSGAPGTGPDDPGSPGAPGTGPRSPYDSPDKVCPSMKPECFIRMQDPLAPCCCDTKPKPPPCPPKQGPQEPREPICDCDLCQKNPYHEKCCDKSKHLRGITIDRGYFEKA
ncbi:uncharacterized protein LOC105663411 isoform X2 [Megachile rotundata]|uniref:uncharacterized protein LOC105663411 isoform X2 n=1 Tax=Megachile rotundata TaxID=143995 RepID=UPI003FD3C5D9